MSEAARIANKHLLLDTAIILESWSRDDQTQSALARLLEAAQSQGARVWVSALDVPGLQHAEIQRLEARGMPADRARESAIGRLSQLLEQVEVMTGHGFEVKAAVRDGSGYEHARLTASAEILPKGRACFVAENPSVESMAGLPCRTPTQALEWLLETDSVPESHTAIPFVDLAAQQAHLRPALEERMERVLRHGKYILGPEVTELEQRLAEFVGVRHCITCANGTDALQIAQMALGIGPGDEVITPGFSFIATAETVALLGAKPVFVDIDPRTYNLDPALLASAITPNTKAIIPVNLYGQCADYDAINAVAERHGIPVIEDAAQSFGATYKGRNSCCLGVISCTSFFPSKPLGCYGDGGALFTNDDGLARTMRQITVHGQERRYHHVCIGINSRLDTLQAAVLLAKLSCFDTEVTARQLVAQRYDRFLTMEVFHGTKRGGIDDVSTTEARPDVQKTDLAAFQTSGVAIPLLIPDSTSVYAQYTIAVEDRDARIDALKTAGIPIAVHYPLPLHLQTMFAAHDYHNACLPFSEAAAKRVMSLPMHPSMDEVQQRRIISNLVAS